MLDLVKRFTEMTNLIANYQTAQGIDMHGSFQLFTDDKGVAVKNLSAMLEERGCRLRTVTHVPGQYSMKQLEDMNNGRAPLPPGCAHMILDTTILQEL